MVLKSIKSSLLIPINSEIFVRVFERKATGLLTLYIAFQFVIELNRL